MHTSEEKNTKPAKRKFQDSMQIGIGPAILPIYGLNYLVWQYTYDYMGRLCALLTWGNTITVVCEGVFLVTLLRNRHLPQVCQLHTVWNWNKGVGIIRRPKKRRQTNSFRNPGSESRERLHEFCWLINSPLVVRVHLPTYLGVDAVRSRPLAEGKTSGPFHFDLIATYYILV